MIQMPAIDRARYERRHGNTDTTSSQRAAAVILDSANDPAFIDAMRNAVTGVNIVTTAGPSGRFGLTVSAFSSVSAQPAMILVCVNRRSPACSAIRNNAQFCVNVLSTRQKRLANTFAGRPDGGRAYDFELAKWHELATGCPVLADAVASFDCSLHRSIDAGTHRIFIGTPLAVNDGSGTPLLYTDRTYGQPCRWDH